MFGPFYNRYDTALTPGGQGRLAPGTYACVLLAELLDRALLLEVARRAGGQRDRERLLARAVDLFLLDVGEARTRGLRARLFCRTPDGRLDPWSVDPSDDLHDLGGELVAVPVTPRAASTADSTTSTDNP
jgi:hypothetical protein